MENSWDSLCHNWFCKKVVSKTSHVNPQSSPPTSAEQSTTAIMCTFKFKNGKDLRWTSCSSSRLGMTGVWRGVCATLNISTSCSWTSAAGDQMPLSDWLQYSEMLMQEAQYCSSLILDFWFSDVHNSTIHALIWYAILEEICSGVDLC